MGLVPLRYAPGVYRNGTRYQAKERWYDAQLMRHYDGAWRPVGGWTPLQAGAPGTVYGLDTCTDPNGTAVTSHTPNSGFTAWEAGIGAFALGASIQSNKIERTSAGAGTQTLHNFTATGLPFDAFEYFADMTRPADAANQQAGLLFRANGGQYSGVTTDCVIVYWDRVDASLVDLKLVVQKAGSITQALTFVINVPWAAGAELCLGCEVNASTVRVWTAVAGTGSVAATRTVRGSATLTPDIFSDASHRRFGLWLRLNAIGHKFDNIQLQAPDTNADVAFDGACRKLLAWRVDPTAPPHLAIATNTKIYTYSARVLTDITPSGFVAGTVDPTSAVGAYGAGAYGAGPYGAGDLTAAEVIDPASWQLDTLNEQLLGVCTSDGHLYRSLTGTSQMVVCAGAPVDNAGVVVTPEKFVVCLGAGGDPRALQWADQETVDDVDIPGCWTPDPTNQAGDWLLASPGRILCGRRTRNETLIWTDTDVWNMQYIGGTLVYSVNQVGANCGIISPHACATAENIAVWMGKNAFFVYDGYTHALELEVTDYVFTNINRDMAIKCFAVPMTAFGEVWFFYPSGTSTEPDRYVIYNYLKNHSTIGRLTRLAGIDRGVFDYPFMAGETQILEHEKGLEIDGGGVPYLESGPVQLGASDYVMAIKGFIPDEATIAGQVLGSSQAYLFTSFRPDEDEVSHGPYTLASKTDVRLSARLVRLRIMEIHRGDWRLGEVALDLEQASRR